MLQLIHDLVVHSLAEEEVGVWLKCERGEAEMGQQGLHALPHFCVKCFCKVATPNHT
jgi:hypothetical protein